MRVFSHRTTAFVESVVGVLGAHVFSPNKLLQTTSSSAHLHKTLPFCNHMLASFKIVCICMAARMNFIAVLLSLTFYTVSSFIQYDELSVIVSTCC